MGLTIKVLTFNVWSIALPWPFGSKDRLVRIAAIGEALAESDYDIVALQELWSVDDYETIRTRVAKVLPESFYFHSGMVGSGVCIFTKGSIYATMMHRYSLNGYPHHIHRGDWFGGKVVGLTRVNLGGLKIDVYATHLHAEYNKDNDLYLPHRVLQAYELSQFINETTNGDVAIALGDLNLEPSDFGYHLITSTACLQDAHVDAGTPDEAGGTCDVPSNIYGSKVMRERWPHGKRLDYVLYRANKTYHIVTRKCETVLGRIPSVPTLSYSDHEAVSAELEITPSDKKGVESCPKFPDKAIDLIQIGISASISTRTQCMVALAILMVLYIMTINVELAVENSAFTIVALLARFILTLAIGFFFVYGMVGLKMEQKALEAAKSGMLVMRKAKQVDDAKHCNA